MAMEIGEVTVGRVLANGSPGKLLLQESAVHRAALETRRTSGGAGE